MAPRKTRAACRTIGTDDASNPPGQSKVSRDAVDTPKSRSKTQAKANPKALQESSPNKASASSRTIARKGQKEASTKKENTAKKTKQNAKKTTLPKEKLRIDTGE